MKIEARFKLVRGTFRMELELEMPARGVTAVFGPSGSGKTTLLRAIAGLDRHEGAFLKVGETLWQGPDCFLPPHKRSVGLVFQEPSLFGHLTVRGNVAFGWRRVPPAERRISVERAVDLLGIGPLLDRRPDQLSGGERQRVAIARALAVSPRLLLMDEPLTGLEARRRHEILPYIESLQEELKIPVLYVSHAADEVARLADHLVLLKDGRVEGAGPIGEMLTRLDLSLAHEADAESLIEARVAGHDETHHLTLLESPAGRFTVVGRELPLGRAVRLRVAARDVSLALSSPSDTSILNRFPATVEEMSREGAAQVLVRLQVRGVPLLARITCKSAADLHLKPGSEVFAQVKSVALLS